ncbi:hypothetical protein RKD18_000394 [Streptomyces phaeoluteigriseus]
MPAYRARRSSGWSRQRRCPWQHHRHRRLHHPRPPRRSGPQRHAPHPTGGPPSSADGSPRSGPSWTRHLNGRTSDKGVGRGGRRSAGRRGRGKASWMSSRPSPRIRRRRKPWSREVVRSTARRDIPGPVPCGWPRGDHQPGAALAQKSALLVVVATAVRERISGRARSRVTSPTVAAGHGRSERDALAGGVDVVLAARPTGPSSLVGRGERPGHGRLRSPATSRAGRSTATASAGARAVGPGRRFRCRPPGAAGRSHPCRSPAPGRLLPLGDPGTDHARCRCAHHSGR